MNLIQSMVHHGIVFLSKHPNIRDNLNNESFVFQLCEYGSVIDIVRKLNVAERKMSEEYIAYILKYTIKVSPY